jgi:putative solute:sodium symporter small subunit
MTDSNTKYWQKNKRYLLILLVVWFFVSYGCGILFAPFLDQFKIGGFKLGFWFAQQGSIYAFVAIIFVYVYWMNKLDKSHSEEETP